MGRCTSHTIRLALWAFVCLVGVSFSAYADTGASGTCNVVRGQRNQLVCDGTDEGTTCVRLNREADPPGEFGTCATLDRGTEDTRCECVPNATMAQIVQIARVKNDLLASDYFTDISGISSELACAQIAALAGDILAAQVALSALGPITFFDARVLGAMDEIIVRINPFGWLVKSCGSTSFPSTTLFSFFLSLKQQTIDSAATF